MEDVGPGLVWRDMPLWQKEGGGQGQGRRGRARWLEDL